MTSILAVDQNGEIHLLIGEHGTREDVIEKYRVYLWKQIKKGNITKEDLHELNGSVLGCFCKPQACHGDVLIKALEWSLK